MTVFTIFLFIHIPIPAPSRSEITLVRRKVNTIFVELDPEPLADTSEVLEGLEAALEEVWRRHCLGGVMLGRELQSQMKSETSESRVSRWHSGLM